MDVSVNHQLEDPHNGYWRMENDSLEPSNTESAIKAEWNAESFIQ